MYVCMYVDRRSSHLSRTFKVGVIYEGERGSDVKFKWNSIDQCNFDEFKSLTLMIEIRNTVRPCN